MTNTVFPASGTSFRRGSIRVLGGSGVALALGGSLMFGGVGASAVTCPVGTEIGSTGVCEVVYTEDGTFALPEGVGTIEALLVGAGGSGTAEYGGGGGEVRIDAVSPDPDMYPAGSSLMVWIGQGGTFGNGGNGVGGETSVESGSGSSNGGSPGEPALRGGTSGNGNDTPDYTGGGSGAGGSATSINGGPGIVVGDLDSELFTDVTDCYGGGGAGEYADQDTTATCGGGYRTDVTYNTWDVDSFWVPGTGSANNVLPTANSGGGGATAYSFGGDSAFSAYGTDGADGLVVIRYDFATTEPTGTPTPSVSTPATATLATTGNQGLPLGMLAVGLGLTGASLALARRARRS
ncbi:MAG TPA: hypothetical protein VK139_08130 [Microbacteriaceae bacterium]|nr:hypothetical protein [Microbacteriaceae bacterium]